MNKEIRELINELAEFVLNTYDVHIPIDNMKAVVDKLGGMVVEEEDIYGLGIEGSLKKITEDSGKEFKITISSGLPTSRRNFTIAHELGHLFIDMGYVINPNKWNTVEENVFYRRGEGSEKELRANEFAAAFLMPKAEYSEILKNNLEGQKVNISKVAEYFNVSVDAAAYRGKNLGWLQW